MHHQARCPRRSSHTKPPSNQAACTHAAASPEVHPMHHRSGKAVHRQPLCDQQSDTVARPCVDPSRKGPSKPAPASPNVQPLGDLSTSR